MHGTARKLMAIWGLLVPTARSLARRLSQLAAGWLLMPIAAWAAEPATARAVGSAIGMALFGYFVIRAVNRRKSEKTARAARFAVPAVLLALFVFLYVTFYSANAQAVQTWKKNHIYECIVREEMERQYPRNDHRITVCECHADRIASAYSVKQLVEFYREYLYVYRGDIRALVASCQP